MLSQAADNALALVEAKIQSRIAKFLTLKEILVKLTMVVNANIVSRARTLLAVQDQLQKNLTQALLDIEELKKIGWSITGITSLSAFYYLIEKQIKDVGQLQSDAGPIPIIAAIPQWFLPAIAGSIILLLIFRRIK